MIPKAQGAVQNLLGLRLQSAIWPFCPSTPVTRIVWAVRLVRSVFTYDWKGRDRNGIGFQSRQRRRRVLFYFATNIQYGTQGMDSASFICAGLIWLVFSQRFLWQDGCEGIRALRLWAAPGAPSISAFPPVRAARSKTAFLSLYRPALDCCATASPPAASLPPQRGPSYSTATQTAADYYERTQHVQTTDG